MTGILRKASLDFTVGDTYYNPSSKVSVHRFRGHIRVQDLTNAGKRGKMVPGFNLTFWKDDPSWEPETMFLWDEFVRSAKSGKEFLYLRRLAWDIVEQQEKALGTLKTFDVKGIDATPEEGHGAKIEVNAPKWYMNATTRKFFLADKEDQNNLPRAYEAGPKDAVKFYKWFNANQDSLKDKKFYDVLRLMSNEGIRYKQYMGMD
jgi:hypothetical protein